MKHIKLTALLYTLAALFLISGCAEDNDPDMVNAKYLGSSACRVCHGDIYATFIESGHNFALNKVSGAAPTYPSFSAGVPNPPAGSAWADITFLYGGFGWKGTFIDASDIVTGIDNQFNLEGSGADVWTDYSVDATESDCGSCHATGWKPAGGGTNAVTGLTATYELAGVQCERCHGAGSAHVDTTNKQYITKNTGSAACGHCHYRATDNRILASGGFIMNHEQYDEFLASPHSSDLTCIMCHDPHKTSKYNGQTLYQGIKYICQDCHAQVSYHEDTTVTCYDCHMPKIVKSAIETQAATGNAPAVGDVRTHLVKFNTTSGVTQFYVDSNDGNTYSNGYITLEYVCLRCHTGQSVAWAEANASAIHTAP